MDYWRKMLLTISNSLIFCVLLQVSVHSLNIPNACKYTEKPKILRNSEESIQIDFFIPPNWTENEKLDIDVDGIIYQLSSGSNGGYSARSTLRTPKPNPGWTSIVLKNNKFVDIEGNDLGILYSTYANQFQQGPSQSEVTVTGMFGFINCKSKIKKFYVSVSGTEGHTVPITFYKGRSQLFFSANKVERFKLKIFSHDKQTQLFICKKSANSIFLEAKLNEDVDDPTLCQLFKDTDYYLHLNLSVFDQSLFASRGNETFGKIVILATEGNFYVLLNTSYSEADFLKEDVPAIPIILEPEDKSGNIARFLPIIVVSSALGLIFSVLVFGGICYYKLYKKNQKLSIAQKRTAGTDHHFPAASHDEMFAKNQRPENHLSVGFQNSKRTKDVRIPPPIPEVFEDDQMTIVYDGYDEPTWWEDKFGAYENPRVQHHEK